MIRPKVIFSLAFIFLFVGTMGCIWILARTLAD
jgi:hypothetical protein